MDTVSESRPRGSSVILAFGAPLGFFCVVVGPLDPRVAQDERPEEAWDEGSEDDPYPLHGFHTYYLQVRSLTDLPG